MADTAETMRYVRYGQVSIIENLIKWTFARGRHYNLTVASWYCHEQYKATVNKTIHVYTIYVGHKLSW